ncbi:hypothetical protein HMSSN036_73410 [Paenibacillus macerans]|nr:hypothetical protein HMSSN036_73410 [Paenibacillus macerans]
MEQRLAPKPAGYARIRQGKRFEWFPLVNAVILILISLICVLPLIHIIAVSFSSSAAASAGYVRLWPVDFTFASYMYTASRNEFWQAMLVSLTRIGLGTPLNLLLTILVAYPLAKESHAFRFRSLYAWLFFITMLFNGGLIPWYSTIKEYGLLDSIWALILPGAVPVFSVVLLLNFSGRFRRSWKKRRSLTERATGERCGRSSCRSPSPRLPHWPCFPWSSIGTAGSMVCC